MKKKILSFLLLMLALLTLASCGEKMKTPKTSEIADKVKSAVEFEELIELTDENIDKRYYGIETDKVEQFSVFVCSNGAVCDEIAVFKMKNKDDVEDMLEIVKDRKQELYDSFVDYVPEESVKVNNAVLNSKGEYVYFVVSNDYSAARAAVESMF